MSPGTSTALAVAATFCTVAVALWHQVVPARLRADPVGIGRHADRGRPKLRGVGHSASTARPVFVRKVVLPLLAVTTATAATGMVVGGAALIGLLVHRRVAGLRRQRARTAAMDAAYPDLIDLLVLTIKAGCSPLQAFAAIEDVAPPATRLAVAQVIRRIRGGARFADGVIGLREPQPLGLGPLGQPLADALALADRHGTPLPPILDRLAGEAREHRRRQADIAARQLPIRLAFPLVGCTLPSFVLLTIVPLMAGTFSSLRTAP